MTHQNSKNSIYGTLQEVKQGAKRLAQIILGASHLAQVAIPALLLIPPDENPEEKGANEENSSDGIKNEYNTYIELMAWKSNLRDTLYEQSKVLCTALQQIGRCLEVIPPQGAMYAMVRINLQYFQRSLIQNDIDFMTLLYREENVVVLPGTCFAFPNSFRVVFCAPIHILREAAHRIEQFCHRHLDS
jgi:tyrosine aminotransferase